MIGIYKITSPSGKIYIGQGFDLKRRFREYTYAWKSKQQVKLFASFQKYGNSKHKFEVIHELPEDITQSVLDNYEQLYMDLYRHCGIELMNIREAGSRGKHNEESKRKLSIAHKGKILSEETRLKISKNRKGLTAKEKNPMWGKKASDETKRKIGEKSRGRIASEEKKKKMSDSSKNKKPVLQFSKDNNFIKEWDSIVKASKFLKISASSIGNCINPKGRLKSAGGFIWKSKI